MPYTVKHVLASDIGEVTYFGQVSGADLRAATSEAIQLQRQLSVTRFLIEIGEDAEVAVLPSEIMDLPNKQYREVQMRRFTRVALIKPAKRATLDAAMLYEEVCRKAGWSVRMFSDRQAAIDWLTTTRPEKVS